MFNVIKTIIKKICDKKARYKHERIIPKIYNWFEWRYIKGNFILDEGYPPHMALFMDLEANIFRGILASFVIDLI